jgi:hypothetical protein
MPRVKVQNTHSIGKSAKLRELHETIAAQTRVRPAQSVIDSMHKWLDCIRILFWYRDRISSGLGKTSCQVGCKEM